MIRSVLTLRAAAGKAKALEDFYAEQQVLERARTFAGCREAVLLRSTDGTGATHLVTADWDSAEDYRRWVEDPWRVVVSQQLVSLLDLGKDELVVGRLFEFV
ncbi:heme-degrading monooxygenase HmoA [Nakamurella sp. UYEF19]|uniref:antibiotic biosynthesis monooxygenase family protein n=1 Tax=Nakamurella sp. UYEF19 TaxID=1756392 RepID=UPI003392EC9E